jgi:hypothetical protein
MVLVVTPGDRHPRLLAPLFFLRGIGVGAVESDRRGVVVQFVQVDLEFADHMGHERQDQRGDVALEQAIEAPPHAVVIERWQLSIGEPECLASIPRGPFADAVERIAAEQHVFEQERNASRGSDSAPSIGAWEVRSQKLVEAHALEQSIDDGQRADSVRVQGPSLGASDLTGACGSSRRRNVAFLGLLHPCCS